MKTKVVAIVQARMGSVRFPGKVMKSLADKTAIEILIGRLKKAKRINQIVVATTTEKSDDPLASLLEAKKISVVRGDRDDVLGRYVKAAKKTKAGVVVRITGDCPLVDSELVDAVVADYQKGGVDYVSNINPPSFPDGLDVEVFSKEALLKADARAKQKNQREHVTPFLRSNNLFRRRNVSHSKDLSLYRWTVDELADLVLMRKIFEYFAPNKDFSWKDVLKLRKKKPEIFETNKGISRNKGTELHMGQKLWIRAKQIIPGGNMLLSKRAEMFLPDQWPTYFSKAKGCKVWDLDGKHYIDMSIMGIGTNTLGSGHPEVDEAIVS